MNHAPAKYTKTLKKITGRCGVAWENFRVRFSGDEGVRGFCVWTWATGPTGKAKAWRRDFEIRAEQAADFSHALTETIPLSRRNGISAKNAVRLAVKTAVANSEDPAAIDREIAKSKRIADKLADVLAGGPR